MEQAASAGLPVAGVIVGRGPLPLAGARRVEVILAGKAPEKLGDTPLAAWSPSAPGGFAEGGDTSPPPGPEWDVRLDPDRLRAAGVTPLAVSTQIRWRTSGVAVPVQGGLLRLRAGEPPDTAEELAAQPVDLGFGPVPLATLAEVGRVEAPRYLRRP
jgi:hypothetical protein